MADRNLESATTFQREKKTGPPARTSALHIMPPWQQLQTKKRSLYTFSKGGTTFGLALEGPHVSPGNGQMEIMQCWRSLETEETVPFMTINPEPCHPGAKQRSVGCAANQMRLKSQLSRKRVQARSMPRSIVQQEKAGRENVDTMSCYLQPTTETTHMLHWKN
ncbi:hypothetical protein JRQ81_003433 [Phrynocephalus forsythii]|uniref:Uncharacterized protein n=1 Tax=Phrynocephalus forsythii TaxID=171643 RepID=A0A9Q0XKH4_9SAUR|nr:hypothetical protein JRQ81_003433 [Phrynocephalus forsythii]